MATSSGNSSGASQTSSGNSSRASQTSSGNSSGASQSRINAMMQAAMRQNQGQNAARSQSGNYSSQAGEQYRWANQAANDQYQRDLDAYNRQQADRDRQEIRLMNNDNDRTQDQMNFQRNMRQSDSNQAAREAAATREFNAREASNQASRQMALASMQSGGGGGGSSFMDSFYNRQLKQQAMQLESQKAGMQHSQAMADIYARREAAGLGANTERYKTIMGRTGATGAARYW